MDASCLHYLGQSLCNNWALVPEGWKSHVFCTNLSNTLSGNSSDPDFPNLQRIISKHVKECRRNGPASIRQSEIMADLLEDIPDPWYAFFCRKIHVLGLPLDFRLDPAFPEQFKALSSALPIQARMAVIKSWGNAWITIERFHESERLPCVFGCGGVDKTSHYFLCDHLWTLLVGCIVPRTYLLYGDTDPRVKVGIRLGLIFPSTFNIALCMMAFKVYHAIKQDYRLEVNRAIALEDFGEVLHIALELILHLTREFNLLSSVVMGSQTVLPACVT